MAKNDDVIAKIKADEAAKLEAAEKERIAKEQEKLDPDANKEKPTNTELAKAAADASAKIENAEKDENDIPVIEDEPLERASAARHAKARTAAEKLKLMAMSYPQTSPDEHVIFGVAGHRFTLGELRAVTGIR